MRRSASIRRTALALFAVPLAAAVLWLTRGVALAAAPPNVAFDQLDLPIDCLRGCAYPLRAPGHFAADYAEFVRTHPTGERGTVPGILFHVETFAGWTRIETVGITTICSPNGDDLIVLDEANRLFYHAKRILEAYFSQTKGGCRSSLARDYFRVDREPGSFQKLAPIVVDGISASGRSARYRSTFVERKGAETKAQEFRITTYSADSPEPCPAPRAVPIMAIFGNTCGGDKRFLIYRSSVAVNAGKSRPAFVHGGLGILNERGHIHKLSSAGDRFAIPDGFRDACARGGHDTLGLCAIRRFHPPAPLRD